MEQLTGTRPEQFVGELRNQIITTSRVLINTVSRFFQNKASRSEATNVQALLLNPKALMEYGKLVSEVETKGFTDKAVGIATDLIKNSASTYAAGATVGGYQAYSSDTPYQEYQPSDPSLLNGF
jgi:hypothetical protein